MSDKHDPTSPILSPSEKMQRDSERDSERIKALDAEAQRYKAALEQIKEIAWGMQYTSASAPFEDVADIIAKALKPE